MKEFRTNSRKIDPSLSVPSQSPSPLSVRAIIIFVKNVRFTFTPEEPFPKDVYTGQTLPDCGRLSNPRSAAILHVLLDKQ